MTERRARAWLATQRTAIERALARRYPTERTELRRAIRYSLLGGGKRVRPLLTLAAAHLVGAPARRAMPAACAVEMVHTYSLVHDDLPAMDDDDVRRGKPTSHKVYGEGIAVLVGDALLTDAFGVVAESAGLAADVRVRCVKELATAAGERGMVGGQALDLAAAGRRVGRRRVQAIHQAKTGALLRAAVRLGAIVGDGDRGLLTRVSRFGDALGLCFQITDDILDAADGTHEQGSYPAVLGMAGARREAERVAADAFGALERLGDAAEPMRCIARDVIDRIAAPR